MAIRSYHYETMRTARLLLGCAVLLLAVDVGMMPLLVQLGGSGAAACVGLGLLTLAVGYKAVEHSDDAGLMFQHSIRRRFQAVCRERGLITKDDKGRIVYPRTSRLAGSEGAWWLTVHPHFGQAVADWERAAPAFALAFAVAGVRFRDNGDGTLSMRSGYTRLEIRDAVVSQVEPDDSVPWRERLASVIVGTTESGQPFALPLLGGHVVVAGITGAGKGSVIWSIALGLTPAVKAGVVRMWAIDPKYLELAMGRQLFGDRYASSDLQSVELLERAAAEMRELAQSMAGQVRKIDPSPMHPVNILFVDELVYLANLMPDRKLRERAEKALAAVLVLGRSMGWIVVAAVQDPRKESIPFRDLFPTAVALKLPKPMVDLVLGAGAHEAGAFCEAIPRPSAGGAGVGFVVADAGEAPVCVRFTWCSDDLIKTTAAQLAPIVNAPQLAAG